MALTPKQRAFVVAVQGGASNKDAAIAAGYAASSASVAGSRLAKHPNVVAALAQAGVNKVVKAPVQKAAATGEPDEQPADPVEAGFDLAQALRHSDPKDFLLAVMNDLGSEAKLRVDAAKALMPFIHSRKGEGGKKDAAKEAADKAAAGRFGVRQPPKLTAVKGGK
ncbi:terminase small subunit [Pseudomonas sp. NFACC04-2]|uniref:terminase small subunit n=1 Tax=Pseudomonas sp. NFACC04-2 TaxID=1566242 RepID=UPI000908B5A7|nr:terminase small subunit [Pseudomonas sp. NFACC04-2]SFW77407.1 Terminase small subunit [Pseudomonas sp. NFACC04-2]